MNNVFIYKTKDFYCSCVLRAAGFNIKDIEHVSESFASFVFEDPKLNASQTIKDYCDKKINLDARTLIEAINELKTRLHSKT